MSEKRRSVGAWDEVSRGVEGPYKGVSSAVLLPLLILLRSLLRGRKLVTTLLPPLHLLNETILDRLVHI